VWHFKRSVFSAYLDELRRTGHLDEVRRGATARLQHLLDHPADRPDWIEPPPFDEMAAAIHRLRGDAGLRELGFHLMKGFNSVLGPIIHVSLSFLGGSPASLYSRAQQLLDVVASGLEMTWSPAGPSGGTMKVRCDDPVLPLHWTTWEGVFAYGLELGGASGIIDPARPALDGRSCEIDIRWAAA
jgi:hypothetical protein